MAKKPQTLTCPSCGAPLKAAPLETRVQCQYCHATIELPNDNQPPIIITAPPASIDLSQIPRFTPAPRHKLAIAGWLTVSIVLFFVGILAAVLLLILPTSRSSTPTGPVIRALVDMQLVPAATGTGSDLLGIGYESDDSHRLVYLDFSQPEPVRWHSGDLGSDAYAVNAVVNGDTIYTVYQTRLFALRRSDGTKLWETSLSDKLSAGCDTCLQADASQVYAITQLGTVHAFNGSTGQQVWSTTLNREPNTMFLLSTGLAVLDDVNSQGAILLLDLLTGEQKYQIAPTCPNKIFADDPQTLGITSRNIWVDPDLRSLYLAYGFFEPNCLEKWDTASGTRQWQTEMPEDILRSDLLTAIDGGILLLAPTMSGDLWAANPADGAARQLLSQQDYYLRPLFTREGVVVVEAKRVKGSTRYEIWGLDSQSGKRLWQVIPRAVDSFNDSATSIMDSDGAFSAHPVDAGLGLLQAVDDPATITLDLIDIHTGVSLKQTSLAPPESSIFSLDIIGWHGNLVWFEAEDIFAVDVSSGATVVQWP